MSKKKRGLGALGVDVLLSATDTQTPVDQALDKSLQQLPIEAIRQSPYQPRQIMEPDALNALAESIRKQGVVQPIVVRKVNNEYELIAGERRWRAAQQANLAEIPAVIKEVNDQEAAAIALIENLQREDLNALEEAQAFANLIDNFNLTHQEVGDAVGRSRTAVSNSLRLLALAEQVKDMLSRSLIEMGHARALLGLNETQQVNCARTIVKKQLSVRATEALVKQIQQKGTKLDRAVSHHDPDILRMEQKLSDKLGSNTTIQHTQNGNGRIQIRYASLDEFEGIVEKLLGKSK